MCVYTVCDVTNLKMIIVEYSSHECSQIHQGVFFQKATQC